MESRYNIIPPPKVKIWLVNNRASQKRLEGTAMILEFIPFQVSTSTFKIEGLVLLLFFSCKGLSCVDFLGRVTMPAT